jgi:hypothetical protein
LRFPAERGPNPPSHPKSNIEHPASSLTLLYPPFPKVIHLWAPLSRDLPQITASVASRAFQYRGLLELKIDFAARSKIPKVAR